MIYVTPGGRVILRFILPHPLKSPKIALQVFSSNNACNCIKPDTRVNILKVWWFSKLMVIIIFLHRAHARKIGIWNTNFSLIFYHYWEGFAKVHFWVCSPPLRNNFLLMVIMCNISTHYIYVSCCVKGGTMLHRRKYYSTWNNFVMKCLRKCLTMLCN